MSRYIGPKARVSRRLGTNIWEREARRSRSTDVPNPRENTGAAGVVRTNPSTSSSSRKQKARFAYGLTERQFRKIYEEASRRPGVTGENMLRYLELRLDNIVYRTGWAATRLQARQFVSHGHVKVNGRRVNIPSFRARKGDVVELRDKSRELIVIRHNLDVLDRGVPGWLETGDGGMQVTVRELPIREQIDVPIREQLIVELYSK